MTTSSLTREEIDTSPEAVERLASKLENPFEEPADIDAAAALRALAAERDAMQSFAQEQSCNAEINRLRVETLERGDEIMKIRAACADAISQAEAERDALRKERDEAIAAFQAERDEFNESLDTMRIRLVSRISEAVSERNAALDQVAGMAIALEPIERAVEAIESVDPLCPDECAALRANFDYWTRNLGRENSEEVTRDSVRLIDLKRLRDLRRAALASTEEKPHEPPNPDARRY